MPEALTELHPTSELPHPLDSLESMEETSLRLTEAEVRSILPAVVDAIRGAKPVRTDSHEDLVSDVMLQVLTRGSEKPAEDEPSAWALRIAYTVLRNMRRAHGNTPPEPIDPATATDYAWPDPAPSAESAAIVNLAPDRITAALSAARIHPRLRAPFLMYFAYRIPIADIAATLSMSPAAVTAQVYSTLSAVQQFYRVRPGIDAPWDIFENPRTRPAKPATI